MYIGIKLIKTDSKDMYNEIKDVFQKVSTKCFSVSTKILSSTSVFNIDNNNPQISILE